MRIDLATRPNWGLRVRQLLWRSLVVISAFLLTSMGGGAIFAAPATVPLLWISLRRPDLSRRWKIAAGVVLTLTATQVALAATYLALGESKPLIWLLPVGAFALTYRAAARVLREV